MAKHAASAQTHAERKAWKVVYKDAIYRGGDFKSSKTFSFQSVQRRILQLNTNNMLAGGNACWIWSDWVGDSEPPACRADKRGKYASP